MNWAVDSAIPIELWDGTVADTRLTKIGFFRAVKLCIFGAFAPQKLLDAQIADEEARKRLLSPPPPPSAFKLKHASWYSLLSVLCSTAAGYILGRICDVVIGPVPAWFRNELAGYWSDVASLGDSVRSRVGCSDNWRSLTH